VKFSSRRVADVVVAALAGNIDHQNARLLQDALSPIVNDAGDRSTPVVLDFSGVEYINSMGLRVLMIAAKEMRSRNVSISVAALQPFVEEIFEIARFQHVLPVFPSVRAALKDVSEEAAAAYEASEA
jgi:anti-anti-sigma factor